MQNAPNFTLKSLSFISVLIYILYIDASSHFVRACVCGKCICWYFIHFTSLFCCWHIPLKATTNKQTRIVTPSLSWILWRTGQMFGILGRKILPKINTKYNRVFHKEPIQCGKGYETGCVMCLLVIWKLRGCTHIYDRK